MADYLGVADIARRIGCLPRDISDAFYAGLLSEAECVRIAGRRAIRASYVGTIRRVCANVGS